MNFDHYTTFLSQRLADVQADAQLLDEARQLGLPTDTAEARLRNGLADYALAVRSRLWLVTKGYGIGKELPVPTTAELHVRLSALEMLVAMRSGKIVIPSPEALEETPVTPELLQRLAAAESRMFHAFEIYPLN